MLNGFAFLSKEQKISFKHLMANRATNLKNCRFAMHLLHNSVITTQEHNIGSF
jgi:hypothetical protein